MNRQLFNVKVVDFTVAMAAPTAAKLLAEWGADVVHVESINGEMSRGTNASFDLFNMNKKSLAIDFRTPEGMEIIDKMIAEADIFMTNYRTEALLSMKLDYDSLKARYPGLIYGHLTGFGSTGPAVNKPGYDTTAYLARAGFGIDFSENAEMPSILYQGVGDLTTGIAFTAGLLAALLKKKESGEGEKVNVSLLGTGVYMQMLQISDVQRGIPFPRSRRVPKAPMATTFKSKDGEWFVLSAFDVVKFGKKVLGMFGNEDVMDKMVADGYDNNAKFFTKEAAAILVPILEEGYAQFTLEEIFKYFDEQDIPYEKLNHITDLLEDEQSWANNFLFKFTDIYGRNEIAPATPVKFGDNSLGNYYDGGIALGQDTAEVLKGLGYTDQQIGDMIAKKCVRQAEKK